MRAMVLGLLALGCVYRVDVPMDAPPDVTECGCLPAVTPHACCRNTDNPFVYECRDLSDWLNCGACGVRCGVGESCNAVDTFGRYECGPPR